MRFLIPVLWVSAFSGCWTASGPEVVVYSALDQEFAEPILQNFERDTGTRVLAKFDVESTKTVGLTEAILSERNRPRCDVFWNNEILHTLRLERAGVLESYLPKRASEYPEDVRSPKGTWHGFAARARVLIVNTQLVPQNERPTSILDLVASKWQGRAGIAKPLFGTTATHGACLFATWGEEKAQDYFRKLKTNAKIESGNRQVARDVSAGVLAWGLTDTDDAMGEIEAGRPVVIIYPDQQKDGIGTLFIPNTLAMAKNCPHPKEAKQLLDSLLTPEVEQRLAAGPSAQIPLHPDVKAKLRTETPATIRAMQVDFESASQIWDKAAQWLHDEFGG